MVRVSGNNIILSPLLIVTSADVQVILGALEAGFAALTRSDVQLRWLIPMPPAGIFGNR